MFVVETFQEYHCPSGTLLFTLYSELSLDTPSYFSSNKQINITQLLKMSKEHRNGKNIN